MDVDQSRRDLIVWWAQRNKRIREIWLCGRGVSDVQHSFDLELAVMLTSHPNWRPIYSAFADKWQKELSALTNQKVSLQPFAQLSDEARQDTALVWSRGQD